MSTSVSIARPPWTTLGRRLESMCRKALFEFGLLDGVSRLGIALSGGKDSLTLLFLLHAISGRGFPPFEIEAFHVTGEFSCGASVSERYLREICDALKVPLHFLESKQKRDGLKCYSCSRERRRLIFEKAKERSTFTVAFGHHRDDSIQTLLMNLLHKAEFAANLPKVPMHDYGVTIIRPLIFICQEEIREFAKLYNFQRIVCRCPVGQDSMRRKTEELLQEMEALFPNAKENLAQAGLLYGSKKAENR